MARGDFPHRRMHKRRPRCRESGRTLLLARDRGSEIGSCNRMVVPRRGLERRRAPSPSYAAKEQCRGRARGVLVVARCVVASREFPVRLGCLLELANAAAIGGRRSRRIRHCAASRVLPPPKPLEHWLAADTPADCVPIAGSVRLLI
jgi:hypothetical protein